MLKLLKIETEMYSHNLCYTQIHSKLFAKLFNKLLCSESERSIHFKTLSSWLNRLSKRFYLVQSLLLQVLFIATR